MAVHMFQCCIGAGKMSITDLETRVNDWVAGNAEWTEDTVAHTLTERNTKIDGTGETYYAVDVRFLKEDTKDNLQQKFTDKLKDKVAYYRVGYHECAHDETDATPCSWNSVVEWTAKDVTIPAGVPSLTA